MIDNIARILDIPIEVTAVLGRARMSLNEVLALGKGSIIELDTLEDAEVEILVNGKKIAYGKVIVSQQNFGIKVTKVLDAEDLVKTLK